MRSVVELRAEARRLRETIENVADPVLKQELAARTLDLSIRAEEIARSHEAPEILRMNISRYRSMLAAGSDDDQRKRIIQEMLRDAEEMLARVTSPDHWRADDLPE
jgi:U3 small nucleolar RNA-associated protein 14